MTNQTETAGNSQNQSPNKSQTNFITINEIAIMLRKSPSIVQKSWRGWVTKWGLTPIRFGGAKRGRLLFDSRDVEAMLKKWCVPQNADHLEENEKRKQTKSLGAKKRARTRAN